MNIEQALTLVAENEPLGEERDGSTYCVYCDGSYAYTERKFIHDEDCAWLYLSETVKEDARIEAVLRKQYPALYLFERRVK